MIRVRKKWVILFLSVGLILLTVTKTWVIFPACILLVALTYPRSFRAFKYVKFWMIYFTMLFIFPFFTGSQDARILGLSYSTERLMATVTMSMRGILIFLMMQVLTDDLKVKQLRKLFHRTGFKRFEPVAEKALEFMPKVKSILLARFALNKVNIRPATFFRSVYQLALDLIVDMVRLVALDDTADGLKATELLAAVEKALGTGVKLIVIVGNEHVGKTTFIRRLLQRFSDAQISVGGILSPGEVSGDRKVYITAEDIITGEHRRLASSTPFETRITAGKYYFDEEVLSWCCERIIQSLEKDVVILDEFGILEIQGKGFRNGFDAWLKSGTGKMILTLRPGLVIPFKAFLRTNFPDTSSVSFFRLIRDDAERS
ncbi:MAG: DUF2478 domain-containing protein [FCB group bacterium]|nr:DUF2478 domain-containing protein [FCB group bacterium]